MRAKLGTQLLKQRVPIHIFSSKTQFKGIDPLGHLEQPP